ncbi:Aspartate aminotransferase family protein OS=Streptomyces microflavus OX=1919 GN=Smic_61280 PE=3 SV=1 [Streptomyces microflavus]
MSDYENAPVPTIVRGEGTYIFDDKGKHYLDGLSGL